MTPSQFKSWRKSLGFKQKDAAEKLGLKKRMIQYYETGKRDGKAVSIPTAVSLACFALSHGVKNFDGSNAVYEDGGKSHNDSDGEPEMRRINGTG